MKITFGWIISYLVGVPLVLFSLLLLVLSWWALVPLVCGLLILPFVRRQLAARFDVEFSRGAAAGLGTVGVVAVLVVMVIVAAGAIGGGGSGTPGEDVTNVTVTAADETVADPDKSMAIVWNARAQSAVNPDPDSFTKYSADEGQKFLVVRMQVENTGDEPVEPSPRAFKLDVDGVHYDRQALFGSGHTLGGATVTPGATHEGWIVFAIPEDATEGELVVDQEAYHREDVSVAFEHDPDMAINMSD